MGPCREVPERPVCSRHHPISPSAPFSVVTARLLLPCWSPQHRSIMRLLGTDKDDAHLYFVLEAVLGGPLYKHIRAAPGGRLETGGRARGGGPTASHFYDGASK